MDKIPSNSIKGFSQLRAYDFEIDIYNKSLCIYIGKTIDDARRGAEKEFKGLDLSDVSNHIASAVRVTNEHGHMANIMLIAAEWGDRYNLLETCVHECTHVSWHILDHIGIQIDAENHEAQAYLLDHLFSACKWAIEDYTKRYKLKIKL